MFVLRSLATKAASRGKGSINRDVASSCENKRQRRAIYQPGASPQVKRHQSNKGLKARNIPSWGEAPGGLSGAFNPLCRHIFPRGHPLCSPHASIARDVDRACDLFDKGPNTLSSRFHPDRSSRLPCFDFPSSRMRVLSSGWRGRSCTSGSTPFTDNDVSQPRGRTQIGFLKMDEITIATHDDICLAKRVTPHSPWVLPIAMRCCLTLTRR